MRWTTIVSTISLTLSALAMATSGAEAQRVRWCLLCEIEEAPAVDTLCALQEGVVRSPADSAAVKALPVELRRRILGNDARWRCRCRQWRHPVCGRPPVDR